MRNVNRTVGTMLGSQVTRRWGGEGLPDGTIRIHLTGSAGQSLGAFLPKGVEIRMEGDANDYVGKGLSGGRVIVHPHRLARFAAEENVIAGNVIGYGATGGELFLRGVVGERVLCPQLRCARRGGGRGRPRVRVHDRWPGGGARPHRPELRRRHVGRHRLRVRPALGVRGEPQRRDGGTRPLDTEDREFLRSTIERHRHLTGSAVAERVLASWGFEVSRFRKVMPRDYKRVLQVIASAKADGLSESETSQRIMAAVQG